MILIYHGQFYEKPADKRAKMIHLIIQAVLLFSLLLNFAIAFVALLQLTGSIQL